MISQQAISKCASFFVGCGILLAASTAQAVYSSPPARVDAIEQFASPAFAGATFIHLKGVACAGRGDGFYVLQNDSKQEAVLQVLLTALASRLRVTINHNPSTCVIASVGAYGDGTSANAPRASPGTWGLHDTPRRATFSSLA